MIKYVTVAKDASAEQVIERSRFIAYIRRVESREAAEAFLSEIRAKHKDATHNVPAFVIGEKQEFQWASDDGEPSGTSGAPMLQMIVKEGLTNVALVVTRYFGGTKLGTGGLVRAYTGSARLALAEAGRLEVREYDTLQIKIPYSYYDRIQNRAAELHFEITDAAFAEAVILGLRFEAEEREKIVFALSELLSKNLEIIP